MKKRLHIFMSFMLLAVVLFTALPKVYIHKMMGHNHIFENHVDSVNEDAVSENNTTQNCDLEKFETPVYFTVFKFILKCSPFKQSTEKLSFSHLQNTPVKRSITLAQLRAPPLV